jgi:TetR/AcrR family transcriptional regulator
VALTREAPEAQAQSAGRPEPLYDKLPPGPGRLTSEVADHQSTRIHGAMIKATAMQGYDAVRVRDVVALAGVSTRAFYELFDSKEDCFLRTHELIVRRAARGIIVSQGGEHGWRERVDLVFGALAGALEDEADAVSLAAVDAYAAGPAALEQARRAQATFEAMISETFSRAPGGIAVPPLVVEGMVASVARIVRARFRSGREQELSGLIGELGGWASCYPDKVAAELLELDSRSVFPKLASAAPRDSDDDDDRAIILAAVVKLAAADGYEGLTVPRIRTGAGISRRKFKVHFEGVEDCFLAAVEQRADQALEQAGRAQIGGRSWPGGVYRAIAVLTDRIASDPILRGLCLADDFSPGSSGSRYRKRLIGAVIEQMQGGVPAGKRPGNLTMEASCGAAWELFHRHVARAPGRQRPQVAATLSYMALAPVVGPPAAVDAIRQEQTA